MSQRVHVTHEEAVLFDGSTMGDDAAEQILERQERGIHNLREAFKYAREHAANVSGFKADVARKTAEATAVLESLDARKALAEQEAAQAEDHAASRREVHAAEMRRESRELEMVTTALAAKRQELEAVTAKLAEIKARFSA